MGDKQTIICSISSAYNTIECNSGKKSDKKIESGWVVGESCQRRRQIVLINDKKEFDGDRR